MIEWVLMVRLFTTDPDYLIAGPVDPATCAKLHARWVEQAQTRRNRQWGAWCTVMSACAERCIDAREIRVGVKK